MNTDARATRAAIECSSGPWGMPQPNQPTEPDVRRCPAVARRATTFIETLDPTIQSDAPISSTVRPLSEPATGRRYVLAASDLGM